MGTNLTRSEFVLENFEEFLTVLPTDCKSIYDALHKERAFPASTDKRLVIELAVVMIEAMSKETDLNCKISKCGLFDQIRHKEV